MGKYRSSQSGAHRIVCEEKQISLKEEDRKRLDLCSWRDLVLSYTFK